MWNWLVSALAVGASVVLYDGSPFIPSPHVIWDLVDQIGWGLWQLYLLYYCYLDWNLHKVVIISEPDIVLGCRAICPPEGMLFALKVNGGVIGICFTLFLVSHFSLDVGEGNKGFWTFTSVPAKCYAVLKFPLPFLLDSYFLAQCSVSWTW